jgi:hypothetical protein
MLAQQWWQVEGLAALACECQAQFAERRLEIGELGSTVHAKARVIEVPPGPGRSIRGGHFLASPRRIRSCGMAEVNGLLVDLRHMPREVQKLHLQRD